MRLQGHSQASAGPDFRRPQPKRSWSECSIRSASSVPNGTGSRKSWGPAHIHALSLLPLAPPANTLDLAIKSDVSRMAVLFRGDVGGGLCRNRPDAVRSAVMGPCNDGVGRAERNHHDRQKDSRGRSHAIRRFSALSLPRFGTMSNVTLAPSTNEVKPAFSTVEDK